VKKCKRTLRQLGLTARRIKSFSDETEGTASNSCDRRPGAYHDLKVLDDLNEMPAGDNTVVLKGRWPGLAAETADP